MPRIIKTLYSILSSSAALELWEAVDTIHWTYLIHEGSRNIADARNDSVLSKTFFVT